MSNKAVDIKESDISEKGSLDFHPLNEVQVAAEKKTFNFLIAGVPYKLKTSHDDATVQELVDFVNNKMTQALALTKNNSFQNAAVLTAMNVAEELILLKRKAHRELERLEEKTLKLSLDLENSKGHRSLNN